MVAAPIAEGERERVAACAARGRRKRPGRGLQDRDRTVGAVQKDTTSAVDQRPSSKRWHGRPKACGEHRYGVGEEPQRLIGVDHDGDPQRLCAGISHG